MARLLLALALFTVAAAFNLRFDSSTNAGQRPVTKVITLLKDMQKQLEKEAKEDEEIYENMACWCTTNDKEKTKAIADAEAHIEDLENTIEELTAASARLNQEIETLKAEVAANQQALEKAKALREKQLAEFTAEEKDLLESIGALGQAVEVLGKHHGAALLQEMEDSQSEMSRVATRLRLEMYKHSSLLDGLLTPSQKRTISAFIQAPAYAPQSGEIYGILKQMKEEFENNLAATQKEEKTNQAAYVDLKAAKEAEIAAAEEQIETKSLELATTDEKNANAKQDLEDTRNALSEDQKYLMNLKEKCSLTDKEFEQRQKDRQTEIMAVGKALAILSSDEAFDTFSKTFNPSLLEKESVTKSSRREQAYKLITDIARKHQNPKLMDLAVKVRLDAFTRVKKAIDDMIAELAKQQEDEQKHKDFCIEGLNENTKNTEDNKRQKKDLETLIEDLTVTIETLTKEIETLKAEIAEMQVQMKRMGENREKENKEFQATVADQRATQKLLAQAMNVMKEVYAKEEAAALLQKKQEPVGPPPPPGFKSYKKNAGAGGVMGMMQQIISDAKAMEAEAIKGEEDAQAAYEQFVKDTNASIEEKSKSIVNKSEEKAKAEADKTAAEEDKMNVEQTLEELAAEKDDYHKACDFTLKNFEIRQTARMQEIEALKQAKAILSGAKFSEFLQAQ